MPFQPVAEPLRHQLLFGQPEGIRRPVARWELLQRGPGQAGEQDGCGKGRLARERHLLPELGQDLLFLAAGRWGRGSLGEEGRLQPGPHVAGVSFGDLDQHRPPVVAQDPEVRPRPVPDVQPLPDKIVVIRQPA